MSTVIEASSAPGARTHTSNTTGKSSRRGPNWEKWGWVYMRVSGFVLVVLIFGHLFINLMVGDGVSAIDFAFVAGKYASPFWQVWDTAMLWLALIHGANGMRTLVNDYASRKVWRVTMQSALGAAVVVLLTLGTLVIFSFEPCPQGAPANVLPSFCSSGEFSSLSH